MKQPYRVAVMLELDWPYKRHTHVFAGAHRYAKAQGWKMIIDEFIPDPSQYDGIIARTTRSLMNRTAKYAKPLVNVWFASPVRDRVAGVYVDYVASGRMRAQHLLDRGFRNFAAMNDQEIAARLAFNEFRRVVAEAGFACEAVMAPTHYPETQAKWKQTEASIDRWMDQWELPIGVQMLSALIARVVAQKCEDRGWRVPEDVGIVCGMNEEAICEAPSPSISGIDQGYERVGYKAAELLHQLMSQRRKRAQTESKPVQILMPPRGLVVRESTDFYSVEDELVASALAFIASNSHRRIGQNEVADAVSVGLKTLQNRFRKVLDRPIATVIRQVRIDRAKRELVQTDRSMTSIARDAGFRTPERMNEVFRRELGMSPSAYRKTRS